METRETNQFTGEKPEIAPQSDDHVAGTCPSRHMLISHALIFLPITYNPNLIAKKTSD